MLCKQRVREVMGPLAFLLTLLLGSARPVAGQTAGTGGQSGGMPSGQAQSPFLGSVPTGQATSTALSLSLKEAFDRALKYNLGVIESDQNTRLAHAARLRSLNALVPQITAQLSATIEQINLATFGFSPSQFPGVPTIVGPFGVADARGYVSQNVFNWSNLKSWKSSAEAEKASILSYKSDRDFVILVTGNAYLQVIADGATVDSDRAQVKTAQTLYDQAVDQNKAGVIASIDVLRAHVQLQTQQQSLIAAQNQLSIDKLTLARIIGLPTGQEFQPTDSVPYSPLNGITLEQALQQAYLTRPDYMSAKAQVRSAELALQAAAAQNYPSLSLNANYGDIGSPNFATSHGTFTFAGTLNVPLFQGTEVRAAKLQADAMLQQRKAELENLRGTIDEQVRTAFFNLNSSSELVAVAKSNIDLADQTLIQAQDRFAAGVADNLSVVQAQQSVATANQSYIASLYSFNLAKISLAQAIGIAEQSGLQYLGVR
jgi:outer membrane protein TolC